MYYITAAFFTKNPSQTLSGKSVLRDCIHVCWLLYKFSPGEGEF